MVRKIFTSIILVVGLIGCNFPTVLGGGSASTPSGEVPIIDQVAEATRSQHTRTYRDRSHPGQLDPN